MGLQIKVETAIVAQTFGLKSETKTETETKLLISRL